MFCFINSCLYSEVLIPRVLWAQRKDVVYLTIEVFEVKEEKIEINENVVQFSGVRGTDGAKFAVKLELFANVDAEKSKISVGHREVALVLAKSQDGPFWPRLLKSTQKMHYIHTDFGKWIDEDEEDEEPEMSGMGNFDFSQFAAGGNNLDMSQFGGNEEFEEESFTGEEEHECEDEHCSHSEGVDSTVKISGLTKNNESFNS